MPTSVSELLSQVFIDVNRTIQSVAFGPSQVAYRQGTTLYIRKRQPTYRGGASGARKKSTKIQIQIEYLMHIF